MSHFSAQRRRAIQDIEAEDFALELRVMGWNPEDRQEKALEIGSWIMAQSYVSGHSIQAIRHVLEMDVTSVLEDPDLYEMAGDLSRELVTDLEIRGQKSRDEDYVSCLEFAFKLN